MIRPLDSPAKKFKTSTSSRTCIPRVFSCVRGGVLSIIQFPRRGRRAAEKPLIFSRNAESRRVADFDGTISLWIMISARRARATGRAPAAGRFRQNGRAEGDRSGEGRFTCRVGLNARISRVRDFFTLFFYSVATEERQFQSRPEGA